MPELKFNIGIFKFLRDSNVNGSGKTIWFLWRNKDNGYVSFKVIKNRIKKYIFKRLSNA